MNERSPTDRWLCSLFLMAVALLCGCESKGVTDQPLTLRMAHVYEVTAPTHAYGTAFLSERIRAKTNDLDVTVYPGAQLGSESELLEQLVAGELDLVITGPSFLAMWHPPVGVLDAAFASRDLDHMLEMAGSAEMAPALREPTMPPVITIDPRLAISIVRRVGPGWRRATMAP